MLKLFQSIFRPGADKLGAYPEDLIERAIERAVDGTDRRLRAVSGYKKSLRPAVVHAIETLVFFRLCKAAGGSLPGHLLSVFLFGVLQTLVQF